MACQKKEKDKEKQLILNMANLGLSANVFSLPFGLEICHAHEKCEWENSE